MTDLKFDVDTMEMIITDGDFTLSDNLSEQNAGLILFTKNINLFAPTVGVGIGGVLNSDKSIIQNYLNRWVGQTKDDGSKKSTWNIIVKDEGFEIKTTADYE